MSEQTPDDQHYEEIPVDPVPEPERREEGFIDPDDTYVEGVDADED